MLLNLMHFALPTSFLHLSLITISSVSRNSLATFHTDDYSLDAEVDLGVWCRRYPSHQRPLTTKLSSFQIRPPTSISILDYRTRRSVCYHFRQVSGMQTPRLQLRPLVVLLNKFQYEVPRTVAFTLRSQKINNTPT